MICAKTCLGFFLCSLIALADEPAPPGQAASAPGVLPAGAQGKLLNLDFETGDLRDWTATGDAFQGQPIRGDTVNPRRGDMRSQHAGEYWIGGYERAGDKPQGTLTSSPFTVTHPWASFLVGGGPHEREPCVELVRADTKQVFFRASGHEAENMERVVVDTSPHVGKQIFIRLVDRHSGHWGHVNFDDFRFHETRPQVPKQALRSPADVFQFAGLGPEEAARAMTVPEGFKVTLFAGEPDVVQPIAMAIDDRARVWVAEAYSYPTRVPDDQAKDRILIFEDKDGDGRFDERKVFIDKLNLVSGLELGFGGVWVGAAPYLLFIPDKDGDDVPDSEPEILLDGWGYQDTHETLNAFTWGPDGWLYGCHGVFTHSRVGKPSTPDAERVPINAGIWRYHPTRRVFEVFAHGTSNPWGVDFDDYGQCFATACVIPHLYHIVQGGRYERQAGQHFNPHTYDDIKTIADHRHYVGHQWTDADRAKSDSVGGGHAHAGAMIYLGGAWPEKYRGAIFMSNIHGARINMDYLTPSASANGQREPAGAGADDPRARRTAGRTAERKPTVHGADDPRSPTTGFVASHGPDFILTNDLWSQIINLQYGPDGNVYMIDWYDKNQCHRVERDAHDRANGRIFKVSYEGGGQRAEGGGSASQGRELVRQSASGVVNSVPSTQHPVLSTQYSLPCGADLNGLSNAELVKLQLHANDWYVRHARRILQERAAAGRVAPPVHTELEKLAFEHADDTRRLRGLWALHASGGLTHPRLMQALKNSNPQVRAWAVQLAMDQRRPTVSEPPRERSPSTIIPAATAALGVFHGEADTRLDLLQELLEMARTDPSPLVRLYIASALQRLPEDQAVTIAGELVGHRADAGDPNLPLMYWYAIEPLAGRDANLLLFYASRFGQPVLSFMVRRLASDAAPRNLDLLLLRLGEASDEVTQLAFLAGMNQAFTGRRQVPMPARWAAVSKKLAASSSPQVRSLVQKLSVVFGEAAALSELRKLLDDPRAPIAERREALAALLAARDAKLAATLPKLVAEPALRRDALRGLAAYDDPKTADVILGVYPSLGLEEKRDALSTLAARAATARALVAAVAEKKIPMTDLSADVLRQLRNIKDNELSKEIAAVWGSLRETAEDKAREIRRVRGMLAARQAGPEELPRGRAVFAKTCQQCHTLFGVGAKIGPDLTGSNRADLEYLLSNVLDPSAVMAREYQPHLIATTDGRVITGLVLKDDPGAPALTVATANETITLPRSDIDDMKLTDKSMMPDDLLKPLSDDDIRALVAYLASPQQMPMLATADNVPSFWNGADLTGWDGDPELWSVEKGDDPGAPGEIVGKTAGLKHNAFLRSHLLVEDFKLTLKVKLTPNSANSGIQFRSEPLPGGEMRGPQADIGAGWWGKLYEENGRGLLWDKSGETHVKPGEWNDYEIIAVGSRVRTFINGQPCVDLDDPAIARRGVIALQIHSGGPTEVRFRNLAVELNPE
jgi:putative membrane-bound dehydrogenase-like protein